MWMSKTRRAFVGLVALAMTMLTVAPVSAGAKPPKEEPTVLLAMTILENQSDREVLRTIDQCGGPMTMLQSTKRLRVDWTESDVPGVPGMEFNGWGLSGCHGAAEYVPEGMAGGFFTLNETPQGLELLSRFDYEWIGCTTGRGKTGCSNVRLYELSGLFPGLDLSDLSVMGDTQWAEGTLSLSRFDKSNGGWTVPVEIDVKGNLQCRNPLQETGDSGKQFATHTATNPPRAGSRGAEGI